MVTTQPPTTGLAEGLALKTDGDVVFEAQIVSLRGSGGSSLELVKDGTVLDGGHSLELKCRDDLQIEADYVRLGGEGEFYVGKKTSFGKHVGVAGDTSTKGLRASGPVYLVLEEPPPGVQTDRVLIGDDGRLYRAD